VRSGEAKISAWNSGARIGARSGGARISGARIGARSSGARISGASGDVWQLGFGGEDGGEESE
jgi:hypothetical protein